MLKYCIKRFILAIVTMLVIIAITFFTMNAIPGGPFDAEKAPSEEVKQVLMERYNLDKPVGEQFVIYIRNILHGDFGVSIKSGREISTIIFDSFKVSLSIGCRAVIVALVFGLLLGCIAAKYQNKWPDRIIVLLSSMLVSVPSFVIASLLMLVFCLKLRWVPIWSAGSISYVLPVISLAVFPMSNIIRYTKTSMLDAMNQNYVRTARAKGVTEWIVLFKHCFRNAAIPVVTYVGPMIAGVLTGSVVVESVFTIGGLGSQFVTAITNRDYSLILGTTVFMSIIIVIVSFVSDVLYKLIDPRIKF